MDFEKLYRAYYMKIYSYIMTIVKNRELSEEITQEVFFKALKAEKSFENKSKEFTWLCAIAKNAALDELKKRKKRSELDENIRSEADLQNTYENKESALRIHMMELFSFILLFQIILNDIANCTIDVEKILYITRRRRKAYLLYGDDDSTVMCKIFRQICVIGNGV